MLDQRRRRWLSIKPHWNTVPTLQTRDALTNHSGASWPFLNINNGRCSKRQTGLLLPQAFS